MSLDLTDDIVNIGSGNGLVPSGQGLCHHMELPGPNELTLNMRGPS